MKVRNAIDVIFLGCIKPIILLVFIESSIMALYLGSNIFKGTDVFGNNIKFDKGK